MSAPLVVVRDLVKYHEGRRVLDRVSFELRPGEVVGLVGPGGHGKSVLLKHLPGLIKPDGGKVWVEGQDIEGLSREAMVGVREHFAYLFQNYALFDFMTVAENIAFPLRQLSRHRKRRGEAVFSEAFIEEKVRERLREVDLERAYAQYPRELSGGMKKRVSLARATIGSARIALFDDPTAGLDPVTSSRIFLLIDRMQAARPEGGTLIISHDVDRMIPVVTRWLVMEHGRIIFDGDPKALERALAQAPRDGLLRAFFEGASTPLEGLS